MKVSGFTIVKNAIKYNYPVKEAILSILPMCDEFVVNVGDSEDCTLDVINSIQSPKIKIFGRKWDFNKGSTELADQTNFALSKCSGDWAFYIQSDEVVHEKDLKVLEKMMLKYSNDNSVEAIRFRYFHFYNSFYRYRIDRGWYQKEDRIIKNNGMIKSTKDAKGFVKINGKDIKRIISPCFIYHYGWVQSESKMKERQVNAANIGFGCFKETEKNSEYNFHDLDRFPIYFGTHPKVMERRVKEDGKSAEDFRHIKRMHFWNPLLWFRIRYKTFVRNKKSLPK